MIDELEMSDRSKELLGSRAAEAGNELETEQIKSRPLGQKCDYCSAKTEINTEILNVLKDVNRVTMMNSRASHKEQTLILKRMRDIIKKADEQ